MDRGKEARMLFCQDTEGCFQDSVSVVLWNTPGGTLTMELPEEFLEMTEENREENYPYADRPEIILEDILEDAQITVQFFEKELKETEIWDAVSQVLELTEETYPEYKASPVYLYEGGFIPIGWFLLTMEEMKKEHVKAVFSVEGKMTLFTLTYPIEKNFKWRPLFKYIFSSINTFDE